MSDKTLDNIAAAIQAHIDDEYSDPDHPRHDKGDFVIDWVVGLTVSNILPVDGDDIVGYANKVITPLGNPNAHIGLAMWVAEDLGDIFRHNDEED